MLQNIQFASVLQAEYTDIVRIVEKQIDVLTYKVWRRHEAIENLENLCNKLTTQAACDEHKPRSHLAGYAQFQRFSMTLRLWIPEAILILECDWTSYEIDDRTFDWEREDEIEDSAVYILKQALTDAQSTEWYI
ncbi:hypothetical protein N7475_008696 [Penicillium sp. IBT 31633x]|nr:hypothetical protein N7475_008696 [Penicillium sp. IBT 31633x]